jgi:hypothetical protein
MQALGLGLPDLFPERIRDTSAEGRREARQAFKQAGWQAALAVLAVEATVVALAADDLLQGRHLGPDEVDRVHLAAERIGQCEEVLR